MSHYIKKIEQIKFGMMSPEDIRKMSAVTVEYPDTYGDDGFPIEKGLMDPRMGIIDPSLVCRTCGFKGGDCQGHFGSIELARPVIHVGFGDVIHKFLRSTCNECGCILLDDEKKKYFTNEIREAMGEKRSINTLLKEVYKTAKRELKTIPEKNEEIDPKYCCPHCGAPQEVISLDKPVTIRQGDYKLTPSEVRERLEKITDEDAYILGVNPEVARPEWLVLTVLPVPPVTVRPSITLDTGERSEDDLTHKLVDILRINQRLLENMEAGAPSLIVDDLWELLQYHVTTYFDNEASGVPPARHRSGRPLKTLTQRLKGKEGRFRSNLSGKRVNFSARTVISPDPNISINEVGVPKMIAEQVTVPEYVTEWNIDEMRTYIENGPDVHPGANYVISEDGKTKRKVNEDTKEFILEQLQPGYVVERHLKDGDMVLFNRQPSLNRMSMMAHEVRVLPYKTFRLNLCVCPPYNADFDGDEMNMHVFQNIEARAEAKSLLRVQEHILSPRFGGPIIGAIHDHLSGAYLLTRDGVKFSEEEALQIIRKSHLQIPPFKHNQWILKYDSESNEESYIYKDKGDTWTGKELFSLLLPNDLNLVYDSEISKGKEAVNVEIIDDKTNQIIELPGKQGICPPQDGVVVINNGILTQGVIDESAYGSFSGKILDKIAKDYSSARAREFLDRSTDMAIYAITKFGMTTSLNDDEIPDEAQERINHHLDNKMAEVDKLVESYEEGYLQALPGRSLQETLEMKIMQVLGEARDMSGNIAEEYLTMGKQYPNDSYEHVMAVENHSVVMARTGARASMLNLTQITACVGQQVVRGGRIERGYMGRALPHFKKGELGAKAKGFVHSSYKSGLDPIEFFFHAMGGREGLVDTAIRTAQSGYMQRRLVNALQDLNVDFNGVVSSNEGNVIQTMFGDDGVDPAKSDYGKVANLNKLISEIRMNSNLSDEDIKIHKFKSELKNILDDFKALYQKVSSENEFFVTNNLKFNFYNILDDINDKIDYLKMGVNDKNLNTLSDDVEKYKNEYALINDEFKREINKAVILNKDFFKQEVINQTNILNDDILHIDEIISLQTNRYESLSNKAKKLQYDTQGLKENLIPVLERSKKSILTSLSSFFEDLNSYSKIIEDYSTDINKIKILFNNLNDYSRVNDEFYESQSKLNFFIYQLNRRIETNDNVLNELELNLEIENSNYQDLIHCLDDREKIINQLNVFKQPISQIEEDIQNQTIKLSSLESNLKNLYDDLSNLDKDLSVTSEIQKNNISYMLNKLSGDLKSFKDFENEFKIQLDSIKNIFNDLFEFTKIDAVYEDGFSKLKTKINIIQENLKDNEVKLSHLETEFNIQKSNYNQLIKSLSNNIGVPEDSSKYNSDDIYNQLIKYNELLKEGIISQEDFEILKRKIIHGKIDDENKDEIEIEENDVVLEFRKFVNGPFFGFIRAQFPNISDEESNDIIKEIESNIVNGELTGGNWNGIVKERFEKYGKGVHVDKLNDLLNDLLSDSEFYTDLSEEFSDLSDDEKIESIKKLRAMFTSDFKQEDISTTLKIIFEQKRKEKHDLKVLDKYWDNLDDYMLKYNLYKNELVDVLSLAQEDIYASKLTGITFEEYMLSQFNNIIEENKMAARYKFSLYVNKKSKLKEFTMLNDSQVLSLIDEIQLLISKNEIRENQITEEFLIEYSMKFRK